MLSLPQSGFAPPPNFFWGGYSDGPPPKERENIEKCRRNPHQLVFEELGLLPPLTTGPYPLAQCPGFFSTENIQFGQKLLIFWNE